MKRVLNLIILLFLIILVSGCGKNLIYKSNYLIGEEAFIDNFYLTLLSASKTETGELELVFEIENKQSNTVTIVADDYFKLYDINKVQIPNTFDNDNKIIKKKEKITYTLNYDVSDKEIYEIYFYSGMIDNNIKFTIYSSDIE